MAERAPFVGACDMLDGAYIEQRLGSWAGPTLAGNAHGPYAIAPSSNRRIFELMLALPREYRLEQRLCEDLLRITWPEILEAPFNPGAGPAPPNASLRKIMRRALKRTPVAWRLARFV